MQRAHPLGERRVAGRDRAAVAERREVLRGVEAERRRGAERAGAPVGPARPGGLSGVLEHGHIDDGAAAAGAIGVEDDASVAPALVKVTETLAPEGGRSALGAVGFDVLATRNAIGIKRHEWSPPPPP